MNKCYLMMLMCVASSMSAPTKCLTVIPVYGVGQQPQYMAVIRRVDHDDNRTSLRAYFIGDIEHPKSREAEYNSPHEHQLSIQKVRCGEERCYSKYDGQGNELHIVRLNNIEAQQLALREDATEELKELIKKIIGRHYDESSLPDFAVAILIDNDNFDEVIRTFIDCRAVVALSSRLPRSPYVSYIVLDEDISLREFLEAARTRIVALYHERMQAIADHTPVMEPRRLKYQQEVNNLQCRLTRDVNCALITIDDAQNILNNTTLHPIFVAYQKDSVV